MKDTLIIYRDWWEVIKGLPTELQPTAFNAICEYAFEGKQPTDPMISAVTALMRSAIDRDKAKWEDVREKRRSAGRRGAQITNAKRWADENQESSKSANADKCRQMPTNAETQPEPTPDPQPTDTEEQTKLEAEFERFRSLYPGNKRGMAIEFGNLKKKYPKKWREIIPMLVPAVEKLLAYYKAATEANKAGAQIFLPHFAYLQTWINNARWTDEYPAIEAPTSPGEASPSELNETDSDTDFGGRQY